VLFDTAELLQQRGHRISFFSMQHPMNLPSPFSGDFVSSIDLDNPVSLRDASAAAGRVLYSREANRKFGALLKKEKPEIIHHHNIYHQISPSILRCGKQAGIPSVMTLHDYKLVCPVYTLFRKGKTCELCLYGRYYHCLLRRCNRGSRRHSLLNVAEMYLHHSILHVYRNVDVFIAPSRFLQRKVEKAGLARSIVYLPNFVRLDSFSPCYDWEDDSIVYFGRISPEKGLYTLLEAVKGLSLRLRIIGDGPLREELENHTRAGKMSNVEFTGHLEMEQLRGMIRRARFVVLPSEWYENCPRTIAEAYASGKPVIGARIGGIPELIVERGTGLTHRPGDAQDLREKIQHLWYNPALISSMGRNAREFAEEFFSPEVHYRRLMEVYRMAERDSV
jgi:glycosyltransferase involved in cell wall biosynthesis